MESTTEITNTIRTNEFISDNLESYKALVDNSLVGIYISQNNQIKFCNQQFSRIFGYTNAEELYDKNIFELINEDYHLKVREEINFRRLNSNSSNFSIQGIKKDGSNFYFEVFSQIIQFSGESAIHGSIIDITEKKLFQDRLKESEQKLKDLIRTKENFYSIIAHDLKNPFNTIVGFSNLIIDEINEMSKDEIFEVVQMINKTGVETMNLLINLLDWSRTQTGSLKLNPTFFDINEILELNLQLLFSQATNKEIEIYTDIPEPTVVYADKNIVNTILRNLISNAIKYTHKSGEIEINAQNREKDVEISIIDNGIGITEEIKSKLFTLDLEKTIDGTNNEKGTGLGLMICKEFVEKSNGKISVKSEAGKGSTFSFSLPSKQ
ncbi:ATP-binding protein [Bacteroidota bacterium]